jgi:DNA-binding CsgD family transcriptional regulator
VTGGNPVAFCHTHAMEGAIVGRRDQLAALDDLLAGARAGLRQLIIEGEPRIGKTTILREGITRGRRAGYTVLSCRAVQAEARLSFAGLADLLRLVEETAFARLPAPQRRGLVVALRRADTDVVALRRADTDVVALRRADTDVVALRRADTDVVPNNSRAIGAGLVTLLVTLAADRPVLLAIDDVQWLDRPTARALAFALRRLDRAHVAVLASTRPDASAGPDDLLSAASEGRSVTSHLAPLSIEALHEVLKDRSNLTLSPPLLASIARASAGNPFYALEIARAIEKSPGGVGANDTLPVPRDIRQLVARSLSRLPQRTRDELLKSSAPSRLTGRSGDEDALQPAVDAGIMQVSRDGQLEFAHPLFAGSIYAAASSDRRRWLHGELAALVTDVEERSRHLALASDGPDERLADNLDLAAERAYARGAPEAAAELAEMAARRTPGYAIQARFERLVRAARHSHKAGDPDRARSLAAEVVSLSPPSLPRAHALHLLAELNGVERPEAARIMLMDALACAGGDAALCARVEISLAATATALANLPDAVDHLSRAVEFASSTRDQGLTAEALAMRVLVHFMLGRGLDEEALERALSMENGERDVAFSRQPSLIAAQLYKWVGRLEASRALLARLHERIVRRGEESDLALVLLHLAETSWLAGALEVAEIEADAALHHASLTRQDIHIAFALTLRAMIRAMRGDLVSARQDADEALAASERAGWWWGQSQARWALGMIALTEGRNDEVLAVLEPVLQVMHQVRVYEWPYARAAVEAVEALVATNQLERAREITDALLAWGRTYDRPWAVALGGRSSALILAARGELGRAEATAREALLAHERLPEPFELGRTLLVLGQLQRRKGERRAARLSLQRALALFEAMGAAPWADKARAEGRRIGVRRAPKDLTESELLVARLAASGLTIREIAFRTLISHKTVDANLGRAYRKLGIHSRAQLGVAMGILAGGDAP